MSIEVKVPALPESVADAIIAAWHKQPGDRVARDETLVELETDKVILEVPAIATGVVQQIRFNEGDTVTAQQVLAIIDAGDVQIEQTGEPVKPAESVASVEEIAVSPSARKLMQEHGFSEHDITGTGKAGRILKEDVMRAIKEGVTPQDEPVPDEVKFVPDEDSPMAVAPTTQPTTRADTTPALEPELGEPYNAGRVEKRVPMTRLRATIANRLVEAQQNAAILTTFNEVNMKPIMELRSRYKDKFEQDHGVRLGFMSFFVKASIEALKQFPAVNASIDGNDIVYHGFFDIGVAVSGPNGLVVPVLRDADNMSIAEVEQAILDYAAKAKDNSLSLADINGGTFTISNGGVFGSMLSTPILNPPQSAILGMHAIKERAMVVDGEVTVLPMMYLALSYDHRIIDGREAVQFLVTIRDSLEDPSRMLLGV